MVDVGDPALDGVVGHLPGRPQAADATAIDLDVTDLAEIDQMLGHVAVVGRLAAGAAHRLHAFTKARIGEVCGAVERLLEEGHAVALHRVEPCGGGVDILAENLPGVDQQDAFGAETLARGVEMGDVAFQGVAEGCPAELGGAEATT